MNPVDSFPFTDPTMPDLNTPAKNIITNPVYIGPYLNTALPEGCLPPGLDAKATIRNPTLALLAAIEGQNITNTVVIQVSTAAAQGSTGILNIPFVVRNANALRMDAMFWIETVQPSNGDPFLQLQYAQRVILDFPAWVRRLRNQIVHYSVPCELRTRSRFFNHFYGDNMNKLVCTLVTAGVLVSSAFAQDKTTKQPLRDSQMDGVTAGSAIAIDNAAVTSSNTGSVNLSGSALSGASAINIVSSSDSLVANGVNIYDSSLTSQDSNKGTTVNQMNTVQQTEGTNATVAIAANVVPLGLAATASATATNIAADSGQISTNTNDSVALAASAEQNASALNNVNAASAIVG